jgi:hypothetical protein
MRQFVPPEFVPGELRNKASGRRPWGVDEETWRKILVTLFAVLCGLGDVGDPLG